MKVVMEKSWNMKNWPKVMRFCDQSWNFTNFAPELYQICIFSVTNKNLSSNLESLHFLTFSAKRWECKFRKRNDHGKSRNGHGKSRNGHGKSRNGHGKVMEIYFVKSVGTLSTMSVLRESNVTCQT